MSALSCGSTDSTGTLCMLTSSNHKWCVGWHCGEMISWDNPGYVPPKVREQGTTPARTLTQMAARVTPPTSVTPIQEAVDGAEHAAGTWTTDQRRIVFDAVLAVAREKKRFTADDVWQHLNNAVPMTMGLAAVLRRAVAAGHIRPTSDFAYSTRQDRTDHDYGRHLRIWQSVDVT